jgi:N6-L-threonylcarbamoyladenine synthase
MLILAFETSCDDTSVALFEDSKLLAMNTKSQIREHQATVGVVPEVAARLHANNIFSVLEKTLADAGKTYKDIEYIACTTEPGLLPSLLVGMTVAKTLSHSLGIPLIPINHIQAHIFANLLERNLDELKFPVMCLTVSGGHNELYYWKALFDLERVGETRDDASGEAFDKVAKMM